MAINVVIPLLIPLEENLHNATRLLSGGVEGPLEFTEARYCAVLSEDAHLAAIVAHVTAIHRQGREIRYSITGGNRDGLFTIDQRTGVITLAAALDYELHDKHELMVAAESDGEAVYTIVQVRVADVNDNAPYFLKPNPQVSVIEEDDSSLPHTLTKVQARDRDRLDFRRLYYTVHGDGIDGYAPHEAFFTINSRTGELVLQRALDRDPPRGKDVWRVRVQVRDGQTQWPPQGGALPQDRHHLPKRFPRELENAPLDNHEITDRVSERSLLFSKDSKSPLGRLRRHVGGETGGGDSKRERFIEEARITDQLMSNINTSVIISNSVAKENRKRGQYGQKVENPRRKPKSLDFMQTLTKQIQTKRDLSTAEERGNFTKGSATSVRNGHNLEMKNENTIAHSDLRITTVEKMKTQTLSRIKKSKLSAPRRIAAAAAEESGKNDKKHRHYDEKTSSSSGGNEPTVATEATKKNQLFFTNSTNEILFTDIKALNSHFSIPLTSKFQDLPNDLRQHFHQHKQQDHYHDVHMQSRETHLESENSGEFIKTRLAMETSEGRREMRNTKTKLDLTYSETTIDSGQKRTTTDPILTKLSKPPVPFGNYKKVETTDTTKLMGSFSLEIDTQEKDELISYSAQERERLETEDIGIKSEPSSTESPIYQAEALSNSVNPTAYERDELGLYAMDNLRNPLRYSYRGIRSAISKRQRQRIPSSSGPYSDFDHLTPDGGGCEDVSVFGGDIYGHSGGTQIPERRKGGAGGGNEARVDGVGGSGGGGGGERRRGRVHVVETMVTVIVQDINDNPPVFPNATMFGDVQENGPIDLSVAVISAWDADDTREGSNARLTYSIEKNVIHERSGEAIFRVDPGSGLIKTALCCLDRETTPEYNIQVVATDGGGLKGTGTVVVRLDDVNDNSPRLSRQLWELEVEETYGDEAPGNQTLLEISAADRDTSNYFYYRVVEASGWGWEHFGMRSEGAVGQLYALKTLNYEIDSHRQGFRFMVQVTDRGRGGWKDPRHLDSAWVGVTLRDINDNPPVFARPHAHVTVREDTAPGTLLVTLTAHDPDMGGRQEVEYRVEGGWGALTVDAAGGVSLLHALDREAPDGALGVAKIIGVDSGQPRLTSTATLTITVTDVNDCAPRLLPPTLLHVREDAPPTLLGVLTATDDDVWALGHGPPFNFTLAPTNPPHVLAHITVKFDPHLDSGRGGAEVRTLKSIDREKHPILKVGVQVQDAGGLFNTHYVSVIVEDINDNPMKPGAKTVYLWKTQGGGSEASLGRVYVDDPDDWDVGDKTFRWVGEPHPLFTLHPDLGQVFASTQLREGRHELHFSVDDKVWGQKGVEANVTVIVRLLTQDALSHATPLTLTPTTPADLTREWSPGNGGGGMGKLIQGVLKAVGKTAHSVEVISVYPSYKQSHPQYTLDTIPSLSSESTTSTSPPLLSPSKDSVTSSHRHLLSSQDLIPPPSTCVWISVRDRKENFMNPVKLRGLLSLHSLQLEASTNLSVVVGSLTDTSSPPGNPPVEVQDSAQEARKPGQPKDPEKYSSNDEDPSSAASRSSTSLPLLVIDTNTTSVVTPRLSQAHECYIHEPETCTPNSCLNQGRCIRTAHHLGNRCLCPGGSWGSKCKILSRTFRGNGWAWVSSLPPCLPTTVSFKILTRHPNALLLYSGPMTPHQHHPHTHATPMLALQLRHGRPQVILEGGESPLKLEVNITLHDGDWHTIHLHLGTQWVAMMVDLCGRGWKEDFENDSHCANRATWTAPRTTYAWLSAGPLQVGGIAHDPPRPDDHGWKESPISRPFDGCLSHLSLSGQLVDFGEPPYAHGSLPGCQPQEEACPGGVGVCGWRGHCVGGLMEPNCECDPGWEGPTCDTPTVPVTLGASSYMKVALSFTPAQQVLTLQLRLRTRGTRTGLLLHLEAHQPHTSFKLHLRAGVACVSMSGAGWPMWVAREACVEARPIGDGEWHVIMAQRHGHNLLLAVDDGDTWRQNNSLPPLDVYSGRSPYPHTRPTPMQLEKHDGLSVGGIPEFAGVNFVAVHEDLQETCLDDLRLSGHRLPLSPVVNTTRWGQVTTSERVTKDCPPPDACINTTCSAPLTCTNAWSAPACSCGPGGRLAGRTCEDQDECTWHPCLHGGTCYNLKPGYMCVCGPGHLGDNCQWTGRASTTHLLTNPVVIVALSLSILLLVVVGIVLSIRFHRQRLSRGLREKEREGVADGEEATILEVKGGTEEGGGGGGGGGGRGGGGERVGEREGGGNKTDQQKHNLHQTFIECLQYNLQHLQPALQDKGSGSKTPGEASTSESFVSQSACASVLQGSGVAVPEPLLPRDDLRAYAYEGDGSSAGSLSSALSGLKVEVDEEGNIRPLVTEFLEVMDLLRNLPEATKLLPSAQEGPQSEPKISTPSDSRETTLKVASSREVFCKSTSSKSLETPVSSTVRDKVCKSTTPCKSLETLLASAGSSKDKIDNKSTISSSPSVTRSILLPPSRVTSKGSATEEMSTPC